MFFFCKQKSAYEMRIIDGSSDVCSSDLPILTRSRCSRSSAVLTATKPASASSARTASPWVQPCSSSNQPPGTRRSEEHTSELQSLMRISYAVFCLKKKKQYNK